jgi:hypothetical protein
VDDCDQESFCWTEQAEQLEGVCVAFCGGNGNSPTCPGDGTECVIFEAGALDICLPTCDPLAQDCGPGRACFATLGSSVASRFFCSIPIDPVGVGEETDWTTSCEPGAFMGTGLLDACAGEDCCVAYCDLEGAPCAHPETECTPWFEADAAPPGLENLGACASP